ncbi:MAG: trypsin-like peptidase domain-containing protein [Actinomycetota bacterium]
MRSAVRRTARVVSTVFATFLLLPNIAAAQSASPPGPSQVERAVTLASPGVVFIDTSVKIHVRLIFQNSNAVSGLGHLDRNYAFDYSTGSGFVVSPTGVVVTASHVVEPEEQSMRNYATNKLVLEGYGYSYPNASSSPFDQYTLPLGYQNQLLQQCYRAVACDFTITPIETVYSAVDVAQGQLPKGAPARILTSTGFSNTDVAVLQVNGTNMPTVSLADTVSNLQTGDDVTALGFPGTSRDNLQTGVTQPNKVFGKVSNIRPQGTSNLIEVDANIEPGMSGGPVIDQAGDVIGLISFSTVQSSGESGAKYLRTIDDIDAALASAGVTPARGPVDDAFVAATDLYWGNHFTEAVPALQKVLDLYQGHPLATQLLAQAQSKAGTKVDVPLTTASPSGGLPAWAIIAIAVGAIIVVMLIVLVSRRKKPAPAVAAMAPMAPIAPMASPVSAVGTPLSAPEPERSVGFRSTPAANPPTASASPAAKVEAPTPASVGARASAQVNPASMVTSGDAAEAGPATAPRFCASCGHGLHPDARFCPSCGHEVQD